MAALHDNPAVSVEATGAWASDWQLFDDLESARQRVVSIWVWAPLEVTLRRLVGRATGKVPVAEQEARWIWSAACEQAEHRRFDLVLDTSQLSEEDLPRTLAPLATLLST